jgi:CRP/FNR family transcriptional regulator, cyclic AMP receptor protein
MLTTVEKVIFLQDIDFFEFTQTEDLAYLAAITEEVRIKAGSTIYKEGEDSDSMYLVLDGRVRLHRGGDEIMVAQSKDIFGTWALFDDEPRVATATTLDDTSLLRISREDFLDLLSDHTNITETVFKALVKKIRSLIRD